MTAATGITKQPGLRVRTAAAAMAATFAAGVLTGLTVPRVSLSSGPAHATAVGAAPFSVESQAYQEYRRGERASLFATGPAAEKAWLTYRAGERGDPPTP